MGVICDVVVLVPIDFDKKCPALDLQHRWSGTLGNKATAILLGAVFCRSLDALNTFSSTGREIIQLFADVVISVLPARRGRNVELEPVVPAPDRDCHFAYLMACATDAGGAMKYGLIDCKPLSVYSWQQVISVRMVRSE